MRIKRLDIMGFKSFPERVQVAFPEGISAVVGPNGCGKSNIVDAIRWVMGEQSPKQLRGRQMDDILFNGAKSQPPAGMAEVTMIMSNENGGGGAGSLGPSEIAITRRLYRSGDSDYLINKVPCRLKDITQFFMDTGMGTKAYAIIEQGRIGALVDAKPEERRSLIDEAAGITRYKAQKREAERKIEATEQNLVHISTVMAETKRQINSLTRAAHKAARYKELKGEVKGIDLAVTSVELAALDGQQSESAGRKEELETRLSGLLTDLDRIELELESTRLAIVEREKAAEAKAEAVHDLQSEFDKLRQEDSFLEKQIQDNQSRQQRLTEELAGLGTQHRGKKTELADMRGSMVSLQARAEEKRAAREETRSHLDDLKGEFERASIRRTEVSSEIADVRAKLARIEEMLAGHERMSQSQAARREEVGVERERLRGESTRLDGQVEALDRENRELVERIEDARALASEHKRMRSNLEEAADRLTGEERKVEAEVTALSSRLATLTDVQANFGWYPEGVQALMTAPEMADAGIIGPVAEKLIAPKGYETALEAALGERLKFILVRDRRAATRALAFLKAGELGRCGFISLADMKPGAEDDLVRALIGDYVLADSPAEAVNVPSGRAVLTREGDFFGADCLVVGGHGKDGDKGLLARRREIEELEGRVLKQENAREGLVAQRGEVLMRMEGLEALIDQAEESVRTAETARIEVEKKLSALNARQGDLENRMASSMKAWESLASEDQRLAAQEESARAEKQALEDREFDLQGELKRVTEKVSDLSTELEFVRETDQQASIEVNALDQQLRNAEREASRIEEWLKDIERQTESKEQDLAQSGSDLERLAVRRGEIAEALEGGDERLTRAQAELSEQRRLVDESRSRHNARENEARQQRRQREDVNDRVRKVELDLQELGFKRQALVDRIEKDYRLDISALPEKEKPQIGPDFDLEDSRRERDELRGKLENMGEVNLTAIGEHDALMERYGFYKNQYDDLTAAIENLRESITRINRTCKIRFNSTFEAVDQKLREIFPLLFDGGEAWLSLTDETTPLDSGVEIHVHPPGKKLTTMSLLSGGEKALVALALIFALYLIKPSPFCLLDETDAPLDEANIDRFNRLLTRLGQSSQIIMVTHNKRTMQISQTLYGVTMEEPGISKMVSVSLSELEDLKEDAQMVQTG